MEGLMKLLKVVVCALIVIGALNWGLWGFFQFDLVAWACGGNTATLSRVIYGLIGLAGLRPAASYRGSGC